MIIGVRCSLHQNNMPSLRIPWKDAGLAAVPIVVAVATYVTIRNLEGEAPLDWFRYIGYWGIATLVVVGILAALRVWSIRNQLPALPVERREWKWMLLGVLVLSVAVHLVEPHGYKILWDEVKLVGTSMDMFFRQRPASVEKVQVLAGDVIISAASIDKRPLLFPFLVSLVHGVRGYSPANAWIFNAMLTPVFFVMLYLVIRMVARPVAAALGLILAAGLPILTMSMSGAGFDLLNVTLILGLIVVAWVHARAPQREVANLLVTVGCLLAHTRYESGVFLLPVAVSLLVSSLRAKCLQITPTIGFVLALLVMLPMQWRIFELKPMLWELQFRPGSSSVFSLSYLPNNFGHAIAFLFGEPSEYGNSILISILGAVGLVGWFVVGRVWLRPKSAITAPEFVTFLFISSLFAHGVMMLTYFYGQFDDMLVSRLALPWLVFFIISGVWIVDRLAGDRKVWSLALAVAVTYLFTVARPVVAEGLLIRRNYLTRACMYFQGMADRLSGRDVLVVDSGSYLFWVVNRVQAITSDNLALRSDAFAFQQRLGAFGEIYVVEWMRYDPRQNKFIPNPTHDMSVLFEMEELDRFEMSPTEAVRVSRVTSVDLARLDEWKQVHKMANEEEKLIGKEHKARIDEFIEIWGKNLL